MQRDTSQLTAAMLPLGLVVATYLTITPAFHIAVISSAAIALFLYCLRSDAARAMVPRIPVAAIGMPVLAWSFSNIWMLYAVMLVWVPLVAGRRGYIVPVYLYSLLLLPGLEETVALGSVKLFDFGVHDALGLGAAAALFSQTGKARPRFMLDLPAVSIMLLLIAALARDTESDQLSARCRQCRIRSRLALFYRQPGCSHHRRVPDCDALARVRRHHAVGDPDL